jgi:glycosyltransferase involved in cell wall biosynthesis
MNILINDFIGGFLDRGMPLYVRNLIDGLKQEGFRVSVVRAPRFLRVLPRNVFYMISVLVEQTALPMIGFFKRSDVTLYPYNSVAVIDLFTRRGRIVVHDLEQLNRGMSPSKLYYLVCYRALKRLKRPVFTISKLTRERLRASGRFGDCAIAILPNTFYSFENLLAASMPSRDSRPSLLLCTGSTANKDLETVVRDYLPKVLAMGIPVSILGLHKTTDASKLAPLDSFMKSGQLRLCGQLSDAEVAEEYRKHSLIWVHSLREGFGRCVVEGRLAGARVICSDIPEFAELRDHDVYVYGTPSEFMTALQRIQHKDASIGPYTAYPYRKLLRSSISGDFGGSAEENRRRELVVNSPRHSQLR